MAIATARSTPARAAGPGLRPRRAPDCSGGGTPWATWLSCDEVEDGLVWELPFGGRRDPVSIGARRLQARGEDAEQLVLQPTRTIESPDVTTL